MGIKFTKIKYDGLAVTIKYEEDDDVVEIKSTEAPEADFPAALRDLAQDVARLCELDIDIEDVEVRGVTFVTVGEEPAFTITAIRRLSNRKALVLNTPLTTYSDEEIPDGVRDHLRFLETSASAYIIGKRKRQMELFEAAA